MIESIVPNIDSKPKSTLHRVLRFKLSNASHKQIAKELHLSYSNVRQAVCRLRKMDPWKLCPECFKPSLHAGICTSCGYEPGVAELPLEVRFDEQSPTNAIHAGNALGSLFNYNGVGFTNRGQIVKQWMDRAIEDPLTKDVKSEVMNELKRYYPAEPITNYAGQLCVKEVAEFRVKYPLLAASKNVRKQLVLDVMQRLEFLYPFLARSRVSDGVTV